MFYLRQHSLNTQVEKELEIIIKKIWFVCIERVLLIFDRLTELVLCFFYFVKFACQP